MKEKIANILRIIITSFILSIAIGYSFAAWTPPAGAPPFNNAPSADSGSGVRGDPKHQ